MITVDGTVFRETTRWPTVTRWNRTSPTLFSMTVTQNTVNYLLILYHHGTQTLPLTHLVGKRRRWRPSGRTFVMSTTRSQPNLTTSKWRWGHSTVTGSTPSPQFYRVVPRLRWIHPSSRVDNYWSNTHLRPKRSSKRRRRDTFSPIRAHGTDILSSTPRGDPETTRKMILYPVSSVPI